MFLAIIKLMMDSEFKIFGVAFVTLIRLLPAAIFPTLAGKISTKYKNSNVLLLGDIVEGLLVLLIVFYQNKSLILLIFLINSIIDVFADVSGFAFFDTIVEKDQINDANSIFKLANSVINIVGPIIAAFIVGYFGIKTALIIDASTFFIGAITTFIIKYYYKVKEDIYTIQDENNKDNNETIKEKKTKDKKEKLQIFNSISYVLSNNKLKYMFIILMVTVFLTETQSPFIYVFGQEHLNVDVSVSGMFISAIGIGSSLCSVILMKFKNISLDIKMLFYAVIVDGMALLILSFNKNIYLAFICFTVFGMTGALLFVSMRTVIQLEVIKSKISLIYSLRFTISSTIKIISILTGMYLVQNFINTTMLFKISGALEVICAVCILVIFNLENKKIDKKAV